MILDTLTKLEAVLAGVITTNQPDVVVDYVDYSPQNKPTLVSTVTTPLNSTTDVTILAAPTNPRREPVRISIYNRDTASATVIVKTDKSGTERPLIRVTLLTLETLNWENGLGWYALTATGQRKEGAGVAGPGTSTDNAVARFDGTGGTQIQNSGVIVDDSNNVTGIAALTTSGNATLGDATTDTHTVNGKLTVAGPNGVVLDLTSPGVTARQTFTPTGGDQWAVTAGDVVASDFGIRNLTDGTVCLNITGTGEVTMPNQPAFLAYNSAPDANVTGDGTDYTVICDTEVYDQGSDYNNTTGIFTAPVTGRYALGVQLYLTDLAAGFTRALLSINTSNRAHYPLDMNVGAARNPGGEFLFCSSVAADMDAGDTAVVTVLVSGSTLTVDVGGTNTRFSGALIS